MTEKCDYLIVGGGLAGATLGYLLKKAGKDVLIVELLDANTKDKLCGGIIDSSVMQLISQIFSCDGPTELSALKIDTLRRRFAEKEICCHNFGVYTTDRKILDDFVFHRYIAEGGRILDHTFIREIDDTSGTAVGKNLVTKEQVTINFSCIVGADGAFSTVRRIVAAENPSVVVSLEGKTPLICRDIVFDNLAQVKSGYSWYIPYSDCAVVGCYCILPSDEKVYVKTLRTILKSFCEQLGIDLPSKLRTAPIPTGNSVRLVAGKRTYFVGDAAGLIQGNNGAGIFYALWSAKCLAEFFAAGKNYETAMRTTVEKIVKLAHEAHKIQFLSNLGILRLGQPQKSLINTCE